VFVCRKKFHVILLHNSSAPEALILCASEHHNFASLMEDLPLRGTVKVPMLQLACECCQWCSFSIPGCGVLHHVYMHIGHTFFTPEFQSRIGMGLKMHINLHM
jgi:hypothetical protein